MLPNSDEPESSPIFLFADSERAGLQYADWTAVTTLLFKTRIIDDVQAVGPWEIANPNLRPTPINRCLGCE
jgi:hypothetical protein